MRLPLQRLPLPLSNRWGKSLRHQGLHSLFRGSKYSLGSAFTSRWHMCWEMCCWSLLWCNDESLRTLWLKMSFLLWRGHHVHKLRYRWLSVSTWELMSDGVPRQVYWGPKFKQLQELQFKVLDMSRSPNLMYIVWQEFPFQILLSRRLYRRLYSKAKCAGQW